MRNRAQTNTWIFEYLVNIRILEYDFEYSNIRFKVQHVSLMVDFTQL